MKLGPKYGEETLSFLDRNGETCAVRKYLSEHRLKPSGTTLYLLVDRVKKRPKSSPKCSQASVTDESKSPSESSESDIDLEQPSAEAVAAVKSIPASEINFKDDEKLGEGSTAVVYAGTWGHSEVALKRTVLANKKCADDIAESLRAEVALHFQLRHPNILTVFGICQEFSTITLVCERMHTSVGQLMDDEVNLVLPQKVFISREATEGLHELHRQRIVHGDIKPCNILLSEDYKRVKLCDMGLARVKEDVRATSGLSSACGTVPFMSPRMILKDLNSDFPCDVWAMGGTITELVSGHDLWPQPKKEESSKKRVPTLKSAMKKAMRQQEVPPGLIVLLEQQPKVHAIVAQCLLYEAYRRPTAALLAQELTELFEELKQAEDA